MGWSDVRHHYEDYDPQDCAPDWRLLSDSKHTARTAKACEHCKGTIQAGERYRKLVALDEGKFTIICTHEKTAECSAMAAKVEDWQRQVEAQPLGPDDLAF